MEKNSQDAGPVVRLRPKSNPYLPSVRMPATLSAHSAQLGSNLSMLMPRSRAKGARKARAQLINGQVLEEEGVCN